MRGVCRLLFSITSVIGNGIFAFTDLAWRLSGSLTESYPEIFYAVYFFPTSVLLLVDSVLLLWAKKPPPQTAVLFHRFYSLVYSRLATAIRAAIGRIPANNRLPTIPNVSLNLIRVI